MGNVTTSLLEWDSNENNDTKLPTSVTNQGILIRLLENINEMAVDYPMEMKAAFKRPFSWETTVKPSKFQGSSTWIVQPPTIRNGKSLVYSAETRNDYEPYFSLDQDQYDPSKFIAKASSFEYLHKVICLSDDNKLHELQSIILSNRDPLTLIFGIPPSPHNSSEKILLDLFDAISSDSDNKKRDNDIRLYKLLLILNKMDLRIMKENIKNLEKEKKLDIHKVTEELRMIQAFCGRGSKNVLLSIDWDSDYTFSNGCKAPPWRQVFGELCYLNILPVDREGFIITASRKGYFKNKGYIVDDKGAEKMNYEIDSHLYDTLVDLLRDESAHFSENIDKQDYIYLAGEQKPTTAKHQEVRVENSDDEDDDDVNDNNQNANNSASEKPTAGRKHEKKKPLKKKLVKTPQKQAAAEPSLKWRTLGLNPDEVGKTGTEKKERKKQGTPSSAKKKNTHRPTSGNDVDYTESDSDGCSEEESQDKRQENSELPAEYYQIQKLVKYLRCGNQTATIIAICSLRDFDLSNEANQLAIRDVGGLDTLVNLLETDDPKCKIGALKILKEISQNVQIRSAIARLDGMQPLVELLKDSNEELKCLAAETIAYCAKNAQNRRDVRKYGGIRKLVRLLKPKSGSHEEQVAISGALALATCSKSAKNKEAIQNAGSISLLANLLESQNEELLIPVVGILQECASQENYRIAIRTSGMIKFLVENLSSKNEELQTHCATAIFKCAEEDETRQLVKQYDGLGHLVNLLDNPSNKELLVAATGAVWKCAQNLENVAALNKLNTIKKLIGLMENQPEDVLVNVVGALGACAQTVEGRTAIRESGGITPLVNLLTGTNQALLVNVTTAVGASALDADSMSVIDKLDGVRLLWSLLKSANHDVQASAAWAISPCIEHAKDAGEMVRSFVGGLELIVSLLKSEHTEVLASVCAAIANIAKDEENLAVITDHGVVPMLAKLTNTRNDKLRKHLSEAIARCCHWGNNRVAFGTAAAVAPLVKYLKSPDEEVHRSTARGLHQLSMDPDNCITMHEHGVVQLLLGMVGSSDPALQEAAAGTIGNIRRLALASEKASMP